MKIDGMREQEILRFRRVVVLSLINTPFHYDLSCVDVLGSELMYIMILCVALMHQRDGKRQNN